LGYHGKVKILVGNTANLRTMLEFTEIAPVPTSSSLPTSLIALNYVPPLIE